MYMPQLYFYQLNMKHIFTGVKYSYFLDGILLSALTSLSPPQNITRL